MVWKYNKGSLELQLFILCSRFEILFLTTTIKFIKFMCWKSCCVILRVCVKSVLLTQKVLTFFWDNTDNNFIYKNTGNNFIIYISTKKSSTRKLQININQTNSKCEFLFYTVFHAKQWSQTKIPRSKTEKDI